MHRSRHRLLDRLGRGPRLAAAGLCLLLAAASAVRAPGAPAAERTELVVVAARSLPAGHRLAGRDLAVARWPSRLRPAGTRSGTAGLIGMRLAGPIAAREPVTAVRVLGADLTTGLAPGTVATSVPLLDAGAADLVHAGDRVDVLATAQPDLGPPDPSATGPPKVSVAATAVRVLAVLPGNPDGAPEVVLAVDRDTAVRITRDRTAQTFTLVADSP